MLIRSALYCFLSLISYNLYSQSITAAPKREFRGVWVATVVNIDWPSKPGLSTEAQKNELIQLLDKHERSGINAIMLQIRPTADAFYGKSRELWSKYLTGKQGLAPNPFYDPLEFAITEAHKRGMELHAWFNPYRATFDMSGTSPDHITQKKPEWFFTYGGQKLFNPGVPEVREYIIQVILDVVKNYDIDGVHFDDYFYPYPAGPLLLPDTNTYNLYGKKDFANINDWRRHNVDTLIHNLSDSIHKAKRYVKFGISPFGIWQNRSVTVPDGSETHGLEGYGKLYADARKWIKEGWIDYINPQIYFPFFYAAAPYEKLLDWWSDNTYGRHLYIGQAAYRATEKTAGWRDRRQIPDQIRYLRTNPRVQGSVFFSSKSLTDNLAGVNDSLQYNFYKYKALQPQMLWLDDVPPQSPTELTSQVLPNKAIRLSWKEPVISRDGETAYGYVIYKFNAGEEVNIQNAQNILKITFDKKATAFIDTKITPGMRYIYVVTAIDRLKNESAPSNEVNP